MSWLTAHSSSTRTTLYVIYVTKLRNMLAATIIVVISIIILFSCYLIQTHERQHDSTLHWELERQLYNRLLLQSPVQDYLAEQRETEHLNHFWSSHIISIFWTQYISALVRVLVSSLLFLLSNPHNLEHWIMLSILGEWNTISVAETWVHGSGSVLASVLWCPACLPSPFSPQCIWSHVGLPR